MPTQKGRLLIICIHIYVHEDVQSIGVRVYIVPNQHGTIKRGPLETTVFVIQTSYMGLMLQGGELPHAHTYQNKCRRKAWKIC